MNSSIPIDPPGAFRLNRSGDASGEASVKRAGSENPDPKIAAREIYDGLKKHYSECIFFFCSADYQLELLSRELRALFGETRLVGCTSAGEITPFGLRRNAIAAFSLAKSQFVVETLLIEDLPKFTEREAQVMVSEMVSNIRDRALAPIDGNSFALSLLDGLSIREELVLNALSTGLQDIPLVGGSAGDNLHLQDTRIFYEGNFHKRSAIVAIINTVCPFHVFSHHHLIAEDEKLVVTSASPHERVVHEFNAEPAALEYCRISGLSIDELTAEKFALHPLAVQLSDDLYIRSVQKVNDDLSLTFFCAIDLGVVLTQMKSGGLLVQTRALLEDVELRIGKPQLVIGFDCIHRRCEQDALELVDSMSALYSDYNIIGFNTYGEQMEGMHLNHTFTGVAIGSLSTDDG